jgi:hypothetical protein
MDSKGKSKQPPPQPVQLPTDTYILSLNKRYAQVETNSNNELIYSLKNPIKVEKGDQVSLYKSYLNIRGLNSNTITIDKDFDVEIQTGLYVPASLKMGPTTGNLKYDFFRWQEFYQVPDPNVIKNEVQLEPGKGRNFGEYELAAPGYYSYLQNGDYNSPYIGVFMGPATDSTENIYQVTNTIANFKVSAGQYDVNALALEITNQLNGSQLTDDENSNIVFDPNTDSRNYNEIFSRGGTFTDQYKPNAGSSAVSIVGSAGTGSFPLRAETNAQFVPHKPIIASRTTTGSTISTKFGTIVFLDLKDARRITDEVIEYIEGRSTLTPTEIMRVDRGIIDQTSDEQRFSRDNFKNKKLDNLLVPKYIGDPSQSSTPSFGGGPGSEGGAVPVDILVTTSTGTINKYRQSNNPSDKVDVVPAGSLIDTEKYDKGWFLNEYERRRSGNTGDSENCFLFGWEFLANGYFVEDDNPNNRPELAQSRDEEVRTYGTKSFNLVFNNENRFAFSNLAEPFRIPSATDSSAGTTADTPASAVGNQATKFNVDTRAGNPYPQECSSGNFVLSFDNKLKEKSPKYKELLQKQVSFPVDSTEYWLYQWALVFLPHDYFYETDEEGEAAWEDSLWSRLGFSYQDLGKIGSKLESFSSPFDQSNKNKMLGLIGHNNYSTTLATGMSGLGDSFTVDNKGSTPIETFDSVGILKEEAGVTDQINMTSCESVVQGYYTDLNPPQYIYMLSTSQYLNASTLPDLSGGRNYFILETDLIPSNYLDESNSQRAIIGFVDKEFSSNDTIFSSTAIPFTIKQSKILNTIKLSVLNADGTKPSDAILGNSSSFILMVQRNSNAIMNYLEDEELDLIIEESTKPTTQPMTE